MTNVSVDSYYLECLKDKINKLAKENRELAQELKQTKESRDHAEFLVRTELEPRIQQERRSYDTWVSQQTGAEEYEHFEYLIDKLCDFVDEERPEYFDWDNTEGDLEDMILFLIKHRENIDDYKIELKNFKAE